MSGSLAQPDEKCDLFVFLSCCFFYFGVIFLHFCANLQIFKARDLSGPVFYSLRVSILLAQRVFRSPTPLNSESTDRPRIGVIVTVSMGQRPVRHNSLKLLLELVEWGRLAVIEIYRFLR